MSDNKNYVSTIVGNPSSCLIAVPERNGQTQIWDIATAKRISRFETLLERRSKRADISPSGNCLAVGSFKGRGVSLYDTHTGHVIWNRADLRKVQKVKFSPEGNFIVTAFAEQRAVFLSVKDGRSKRISLFKKTLSGVRDVYPSPFDPVIAVDAWDEDLRIDSNKNGKICSIVRKTFGVLAQSFSPNQYCVSESGGPLTCYDIQTGEELWEFDSGSGIHSVCVSFVSELNAYASIEWPFEEGGDYTLRLIDRDTGKQQMCYDVPSGSPGFIDGGKQMVFPDGAIVETATGQTVQKLDFLGDIS